MSIFLKAVQRINPSQPDEPKKWYPVQCTTKMVKRSSLHCECGFKHLTNYPDPDVKSMGSEHNYRSRRPMETRTYSIL